MQSDGLLIQSQFPLLLCRVLTATCNNKCQCPHCGRVWTNADNNIEQSLYVFYHIPSPHFPCFSIKLLGQLQKKIKVWVKLTSQCCLASSHGTQLAMISEKSSIHHLCLRLQVTRMHIRRVFLSFYLILLESSFTMSHSLARHFTYKMMHANR